jgi:hypothetical protein
MLFLLFGSSGAGKTIALHEVRTRAPADLAIHDFDEIGVPPHADRAWRQRTNETWVQRALDYEAAGTDLLLAGQTPFGELLATPSAPLLDCISGCLLDCDDETRAERLSARDERFWYGSSGSLRDYVNWARWLRGHAADPQWHVEVIRQDDESLMSWDRWESWAAGDPRWRVLVIDTSQLRAEHVADLLVHWIEEERSLHRNGSHPLAGWAA